MHFSGALQCNEFYLIVLATLTQQVVFSAFFDFIYRNVDHGDDLSKSRNFGLLTIFCDHCIGHSYIAPHLDFQLEFAQLVVKLDVRLQPVGSLYGGDLS